VFCGGSAAVRQKTNRRTNKLLKDQRVAAVARRSHCGGCGGPSNPLILLDAAVLRRLWSGPPTPPKALSGRFRAPPGLFASSLAPLNRPRFGRVELVPADTTRAPTNPNTQSHGAHRGRRPLPPRLAAIGGPTNPRRPNPQPTKSPRYLEGHFWVNEGRATPIFEYLHKFYLWGSASELKEKQNEHDIGF
jgi:hypothetical protein